MLLQLFQLNSTDSLLPAAAVAFLLTLLGILVGTRFLPKDHGREFAVNGALSKGKARGAGLILILALIVSAILCIPLKLEYIIYLAALFLEMMSGYLDDAAEKAWGELKKGLIDLAIAVAVSFTIYWFHGSDVELFGLTFHIPAALYIILGIILIWASINVTNCADGVDGLCASLSIVTMLTAVTFFLILPDTDDDMLVMLMMAVGMLTAYLWFNCSPSSILMGDAGSRALGLLIAMGFMISGSPFLFIPAALLLLIDGGMGLLKLTVLRVTKSSTFMQNIRTPIHDHARKNKGWSDTQVVVRFTLLQVVLSAAVIVAEYMTL